MLKSRKSSARPVRTLPHPINIYLMLQESCASVWLELEVLLFCIPPNHFLNIINDRFQRRYHSGESCVHERHQEKFGEKREGSSQKGRYPRSLGIRKRSQKTQMNNAVATSKQIAILFAHKYYPISILFVV